MFRACLIWLLRGEGPRRRPHWDQCTRYFADKIAHIYHDSDSTVTVDVGPVVWNFFRLYHLRMWTGSTSWLIIVQWALLLMLSTHSPPPFQLPPSSGGWAAFHAGHLPSSSKMPPTAAVVPVGCSSSRFDTTSPTVAWHHQIKLPINKDCSPNYIKSYQQFTLAQYPPPQ